MKRIILFLAILTLLTGCDYVVKPSLIEGESAKLYVLGKSLNDAGADELRQMFFDYVCSKDTRHRLDTTTLDGMMGYDGLRRIMGRKSWREYDWDKNIIELLRNNTYEGESIPEPKNSINVESFGYFSTYKEFIDYIVENRCYCISADDWETVKEFGYYSSSSLYNWKKLPPELPSGDYGSGYREVIIKENPIAIANQVCDGNFQFLTKQLCGKIEVFDWQKNPLESANRVSVYDVVYKNHLSDLYVLCSIADIGKGNFEIAVQKVSKMYSDLGF